MQAQDKPSESQWAQLREAQLQVSKTIPQTGLVTTIDVGEADNIHPKDKTTVGHRAALLALERWYGKPVEGESPWCASARVKGNKVHLKFKNLDGGLASPGGGPVTGFALAGEDQVFYWAQAQIDRGGVLVWSDQVPHPAEVRYGWADNPVCNLFSRGGLPAGPFRLSLGSPKGTSKP